MNEGKPVVVYLKDYQVPDFIVNSIELLFQLGDTTTVQATIHFQRNPKSTYPKAPLVLNGSRELITLHSVSLNGQLLVSSQYEVSDTHLTLASVPDEFTLETRVSFQPAQNTRLSGLYESSGNLCTQCESEGFRRITYFLDRPDVMTYFRTIIQADPTRYPILLSNGNFIRQHALPDGRVEVVWEDPSLKPCYLFALVAGRFDVLEDIFITRSGRRVDLKLYVEVGYLDQANFAMQSLKQSMKWDEDTYGREYDLNIFMIVAVGDFNYGAMENKGLNIFNTKYILAKPQTATDSDYLAIQGVIGHEYFHNWSGNRVTCRDWFQISLKEGLTVFRDQNFSADMTDPAVKRIQDVNIIRSTQFPQDAGPMAHPVRPDSYIEINNFYTVTVYNKGAEVIRMMATLLGRTKFQKAMNLYFERHDGQAVTTEEFVKAMEEGGQVDLTQFRRWYTQAGTPVLTVQGHYDASHKTYELRVKQSCPPTPGQPIKEPFHIPLSMALLSPTGHPVSLRLKGDTQVESECVLSIQKPEHRFVFEGVAQAPIPSLLRHFSAPVKLDYPYTNEELQFLLAHETDDFNRWEAGQRLGERSLFALLRSHQEGRELVLDSALSQAWRAVLTHTRLSLLFKAQALVLPNLHYLMQCQEPVDVIGLHTVREWLRESLGKALNSDWQIYYDNQHPSSYRPTIQEIGGRALRNLALGYLLLQGDATWYKKAFAQVEQADNLTDQLGALTPLMNIDCDERMKGLDLFYNQINGQALMLDRWFSLQAGSWLPGAIDRVKALVNHRDFTYKNPNRVRSVVTTFTSQNLVHFHDISGAGYQFLAEQVLKVDQLNPQVAGRLMEPFNQWRRFDSTRGELMKQRLEFLASQSLSKDVYEIVTKALA